MSSYKNIYNSWTSFLNFSTLPLVSMILVRLKLLSNLPCWLWLLHSSRIWNPPKKLSKADLLLCNVWSMLVPCPLSNGTRIMRKSNHQNSKHFTVLIQRHLLLNSVFVFLLALRLLPLLKVLLNWKLKSVNPMTLEPINWLLLMNMARRWLCVL